MKTVCLLFPHQLFENNPLFSFKAPCYLLEEQLFFTRYAFHKQKIAFHRASMRAFADHAGTQGISLIYIEAQDSRSDIRLLIPDLAKAGVGRIEIIDPVDDWLLRRISSACTATGISLHISESPCFLNDNTAIGYYFKKGRKRYHQTQFYTEQRKQRGILLDNDRKPKGGKWTFDTENRKKYPAKKVPPPIHFPDKNPYYEEAVAYTELHFANNPGSLETTPWYPTTYSESQAWLDQFLQFRFAEFGTYEDAIVKSEYILNHSVLTPMLNVGLLTPQHLLESSLDFAETSQIPINSTEGFVRQIIGWREFIRGIYQVHGGEIRTRNFWNFNRKIPASFYDGTTGIEPIDNTIKKVLRTGYCHHIERLMILGNFMLLCEFDPNEVYRWFMELFIDAYDWVMVPNIYGMSQFSDGGLFATKPYISGSNYVIKMSDYKKGDWQQVWDGLFWRFMDVHRDFFLKNPRLGMLVRTYDKMHPEKQEAHHAHAARFLDRL
ncbi:MAG: cryptochrome/photolyase family protein [Flavobacteriaceae bacterium]|nr:cryptochrome/photolyase family protein [Flavobacteriaceae bacterium]